MATDRLPIGIGLNLPTWPLRDGSYASWAQMRRLAQAMEALAVDTLWVPDHLQRETPKRGTFGFWECWTILTAAAEATSRIGIGPFIACTGFRNPALLAKMAETLDEVSGGRLILGLGAGDAEAEHRALGVPYAGRVGRFEESLGIIRTLFTGGTVTHNGVHYRVDGAVLTTRGPRLTGPPLLIGSLGTGPRMLRLVAQYGDLWNGFLAYGDSRPEALATPLAALDAACVLVGRDPGTPIRTATVAVGVLGQRPALGVGIVGTPREIADALRAFGQMGITHLQVMLTPNTLAGIDAFACVLDVLEHG
jgi:alkanesulfonate monooxygenase SsuD/methylene tetrahydromethanopterin reductase-like flavin-dependent oxidoreductase (luciferase family)